MMEWFERSPGVLDGLTPWGVTVAHVEHLAEGGADSGPLELARFMAGALNPAQLASLPSRSAAGWWWTGTAHERGMWVKAGPFPTAEAAKADLLDKWTYSFEEGLT